MCALLFILFRLVWNDGVTWQINFPNVGAILILYTTRDERHWRCLLICIPSGIHIRHFFLHLLHPRPLFLLHTRTSISNLFRLPSPVFSYLSTRCLCVPWLQLIRDFGFLWQANMHTLGQEMPKGCGKRFTWSPQWILRWIWFTTPAFYSDYGALFWGSYGYDRSKTAIVGSNVARIVSAYPHLILLLCLQTHSMGRFISMIPVTISDISFRTDSELEPTVRRRRRRR